MAKLIKWRQRDAGHHSKAVVRLLFLPRQLERDENIDRIDHFTVACLVAWPLNESEAGVDIVLIQTFLLFLC